MPFGGSRVRLAPNLVVAADEIGHSVAHDRLGGTDQFAALGQILGDVVELDALAGEPCEVGGDARRLVHRCDIYDDAR